VALQQPIKRGHVGIRVSTQPPTRVVPWQRPVIWTDTTVHTCKRVDTPKVYEHLFSDGMVRSDAKR
jgi:hypothetical protein